MEEVRVVTTKTPDMVKFLRWATSFRLLRRHLTDCDLGYAHQSSAAQRHDMSLPRNAPIFLARWTLAALLGLLLCACGSSPERSASPQPPIDLRAFMGTWYVTARIPNALERGHMASRDVYTLQPDGKIAVHYVYRTGPREPEKVLDIVATVLPDTGNRVWRMRFFKIVPTRQRILEVAPDGSWALLDSPGRDLAWIFTRKPRMDDAQYLELRARLREHGIDTDKVWRVPHTAEEVGKRGYDVPRHE
jgi:apolipoprotein D and lipocalin family protein